VRLFYQIDVLVDGIGCSLVPGLVRRAHLSRHRDYELVFEHAPELPAFAEMLQQRLAAELGQYIDRIDSGVNKVTEDEIDNAILAAERHGRFGPLLGQRKQPGALAPGKHDSQDAYAHKRMNLAYFFRQLEFWQEEPLKNSRVTSDTNLGRH